MTAAHSGISPNLARALAATLALLVSLLALGLGPTDAAYAGDCKRVRVGKFKVKKIRVSDPVSCRDARKVAKQWVKRGYDDFNPILRGNDTWFCSWRRKAPKSATTGTAECDADPGEEIDFAVRKRRWN
jgi:hypothetical protein